MQGFSWCASLERRCHVHVLMRCQAPPSSLHPCPLRPSALPGHPHAPFTACLCAQSSPLTPSCATVCRSMLRACEMIFNLAIFAALLGSVLGSPEPIPEPNLPGGKPPRSPEVPGCYPYGVRARGSERSRHMRGGFVLWSIEKVAMLGLHLWWSDARCWACLLYTSPSPRDGLLSRMPSSA